MSNIQKVEKWAKELDVKKIINDKTLEWKGFIAMEQIDDIAILFTVTRNVLIYRFIPLRAMKQMNRLCKYKSHINKKKHLLSYDEREKINTKYFYLHKKITSKINCII